MLAVRAAILLSACNFVEQNLSPAAEAPARRGGGVEAVNFATEITEAKECCRRTAQFLSRVSC